MKLLTVLARTSKEAVSPCAMLVNRWVPQAAHPDDKSTPQVFSLSTLPVTLSLPLLPISRLVEDVAIMDRSVVCEQGYQEAGRPTVDGGRAVQGEQARELKHAEALSVLHISYTFHKSPSSGHRHKQ